MCIWFTRAKFKKRNKQTKNTSTLACPGSNIEDTYGNKTSLLTERRAFQPQDDFSSCSQFQSPAVEFGNIPAEGVDTQIVRDGMRAIKIAEIPDLSTCIV